MSLRAACLIVALALLGSGIAAGQRTSSEEPITFPGASLKWMHVAEPRIRKEHLKLEHYMVLIFEDKDEVTVCLQALDANPEAFGSSGSYPDYAVEIRKADSRIIRSYYQR